MLIRATYTTIPGTEASEGRSGEHAVVADRPDGVAGGQGRGFNGGQLMALAVGGCLCNDLRYAAHRAGIELGPFDVAVDLDVDDHARVAGIWVALSTRDGHDAVAALLDDAVAASTIVNAVRDGAPVEVSLS